jgi:serine/threonine-protein kinase
MLDVGQRVRDYEVLAHLKPGGMATLFLARRVGPSGFARPVAIKVVHPHLAEVPEFVRMFLDEARLSACIQHPNVVHVEELGEAFGSYFLAMEYVHGDSLATLLSSLERVERRLPIECAVSIAAAAAAGLHAAHETTSEDGSPLGIVHRDVSPQNVLVSIDGYVKVIDFGIAKARGSATHTELGTLKGKLAYMSPEQARGEPVDRRTDVYALGIVLWEMLTMRRLFSAPLEAAVLDAVMNPRVMPPSTTVPDLPAALDAVVLRALAAEPSERFATGAALQAALLESVPAAATAGPRLARWVEEQLGDRIVARRKQFASATIERRMEQADRIEALEPTHTASAPNRPDTRSLAVMPFRTMVGDAAIVDGIEAELRDVLSRVRGLRVKSRVATQRNEDVSAYGERLGVAHVVTGRMHTSDAGVRLAIALTNVEDGFQIWSQKLEQSLADTWRAVDEVAGTIAHALGDVKLRGERATGDDASIELTMELRRLLDQPVIPDDAPLLALRERAHRDGPRDPLILAACATALTRATYWPHPPDRALELAQADAVRAIELAPDLPEPWVAIAQVRLANADSSGAMRALRRAITNGPSVAEAHDLVGRVLADADRLDEALRSADRALWLDPAALFARREKVRMHALLGDWPAAERELETLRPLSLEHYVAAGPRVGLWAGRRLGPRLPLDPTHVMAPLVGAVDHVLDDGTLRPIDVEAFDVRIAEAKHVRARRFFFQVKAELHSAVGQHDRALEATIAAIDEGLEDLAWVERCPLVAPFRSAASLVAPIDRVRRRADAIRRAWDDW